MGIRRYLLTVLIIAVCALSFADGLYVTSNLYPLQKQEGFAAQLGLEGSTYVMPQNAVSLASGSESYMVTPGDVYTVTYSSPSAVIKETISVDGRLNAQIPFSGSVNCTGLSFLELKDLVENAIVSVYSYSKPQMTIVSLGMYSVPVSSIGEVQLWGLSRLSDLACLAPSYASTREVLVTYPNGETVSCDLYNALVNLDGTDNPLLRPGCKVEFVDAKTTVTLSGEVRQSGTYQALDNETVYDVITSFGHGLTSFADDCQISVMHASSKAGTDLITLDQARSYALTDGDSILVSRMQSTLSYVTVTGSLNGTSSKILYQFFPGETVGEALTALSGRFDSTSDIEAVTLTHADGKTETVSRASRTVLCEGDQITVPFAKQTVTVSGAVSKPASYAYEPGKTYSYYIDLAGGYTSDARISRTKMTDSNESKISLNSIVPSGAVISVPHRNTNLASNIALVSSALALISAIVSMFTK